MSSRGSSTRGRGGRGGSRGGRGGGKSSSGTSGAGGGGGGGGEKRVYTSKRPVGGRGIFVTCVRGRETRCAGEMYDLLDEVADELYPKERIEEFKRLFPHKFPSAEGAAPAAGAGAVGKEGEEGAAESGPATSTPAPIVPVESSSDSEDEDDSIEASIARELASLKSKKPRLSTRAPRAPAPLGPDGKPLPRVRPPKPRFQSLETKTECLVFIAVAWPYDPVELVNAIIRQVRETGVSKTRYTQRLEPVSLSTSSLGVEVIREASGRLVESVFQQFARREGRREVTYQIEPSLRNHTEPLSRAVLIDILGSAVRALAEPLPEPKADEEGAATTAPAVDAALAEAELTLPSTVTATPGTTTTTPLAEERQLLTVSANLKTPDLVLLPIVLKNTYGLGIVEGSLWAGPMGRKFNLDAIAQEWRKRELETRGETAVGGVELVGEKKEEEEQMDDA